MKKCWPILIVLMMMASCYYPQQDTSGWGLTPEMQDSLDFTATHHYNVGYNFLLATDSLVLQHERPMHYAAGEMMGDSVTVYLDDPLVVAQVLIIPEDSLDSVWVMVARDQYTMGWTREQTLLLSIVPDDPISQFIHTFSSEHLWYFLGIIGCVTLLLLVMIMRRTPFYMVHLRDIPSCYPTFLCISLSTSAVLYASMQKFVPQTWVEYYFHPTLNPFDLPPILGLFIASIWLMFILLGATLDDLRRQLTLWQAMQYLFSLAGVCMICYLFFSLTTLYWVGYPCLLVYVTWALVRYRRHYRPLYVCGKCGAKLHSAGTCPRCGANNVAP